MLDSKPVGMRAIPRHQEPACKPLVDFMKPDARGGCGELRRQDKHVPIYNSANDGLLPSIRRKDIGQPLRAYRANLWIAHPRSPFFTGLGGQHGREISAPPSQDCLRSPRHAYFAVDP